MSTDLIARLRRYGEQIGICNSAAEALEQQAAEIARLRAALQEADTIMGHDDGATDWRDEWAPLFRMPDDAAREST